MPQSAAPLRTLESSRLYSPPLQPLLLWQSLSLFWLCGILAARWPLPALLCALLLVWTDTRLRRTQCLLIGASLLALGCAFTFHSLPQRPAPPLWLKEAQSHKGSLPRLQAVVDKVQGLPDQRLRIVLRDVRPVAGQPPLPGLMVWTWDAFPQGWQRPIPGQQIKISAMPRSTMGFRNPGQGDSGDYWAMQGVFWRLWTKGQGDKGGHPELLSGGNISGLWREEGRQKLEKQLLVASSHIKSPHVERELSQSTSLRSSPPSFMDQGLSFLPALLFGDRFHLSSDTVRRMGAASLAHSLALSGQHLGLVVLCAIILLHIIARCYPILYVHIPNIKLIPLISIPLGAMYLWLGGFPASLLRAYIMLVLAAIFLWGHMVRSLEDILLLTLLGISLCNPLAIFDVGLQFSVLCVAAIALMVPFLQRLPHRASDYGIASPFRFLLQTALISLGIQAALLPLTLTVFESSGAWFALNVLWLPVLGLWVLPVGAVGLILAWCGLGFSTWILAMAAWPCSMLVALLQSMDQAQWLSAPALLRPHWTALPAWAALLTALAILPGRWRTFQKGRRHKKKLGHWSTIKLGPWGVLQGEHTDDLLRARILRLVMAAALLLCVGPALRVAENWNQGTVLTMLDVGQGQALHLRLPGGQGVLVDGGGSTSTRFDPGKSLVIPTITSNAAPRLMAAVSTHPDMDHLRGLVAVFQSMQVQKFFHNGEAAQGREAALLAQIQKMPPQKALHAGMSLPVPGSLHLELEVLHPPQGPHGFSGNNASVVLRLTHTKKGQKRGLALLTGDVEIPALKALLASGQDISAEVLILPHHGSGRSLLPEFYDAVAPQLALASCGQGNRFGFPDLRVQEALRQRGIPLYTTADHGAVPIEWTKQGITIKATPPWL